MREEKVKFTVNNAHMLFQETELEGILQMLNLTLTDTEVLLLPITNSPVQQLSTIQPLTRNLQLLLRRLAARPCPGPDSPTKQRPNSAGLKRLRKHQQTGGGRH